MDVDAREQAGVSPIQEYLDSIENAKTLKELIAADCRMQKELGISTLLGFGLTTGLLRLRPQNCSLLSLQRVDDEGFL